MNKLLIVPMFNPALILFAVEAAGFRVLREYLQRLPKQCTQHNLGTH